MAVGCEIRNCGVTAEGRCRYCGHAFCRSHSSASRPGYYATAPWPYGPVINGCGECQEQAIDDATQANLATKRQKQDEIARIAALPQMPLAMLAEYLRTASGSAEFNGTHVRGFSSRDVARAMVESGRHPQPITANAKGFMGRPKRKTQYGWALRRDSWHNDMRSHETTTCLLADGSVQPYSKVFGWGNPEIRDITSEEIAALSARRLVVTDRAV